MTRIKRPGVYIVEKNAFPNSIVLVAIIRPEDFIEISFEQQMKKTM